MTLPKYSKSRIARLTGGKSLLILVAIIVGFYSLNNYRYNDPLPISTNAPNIMLKTADGQAFELYDIHMPIVLVFYNDAKFMGNNIYPLIYKRQMPNLKFLQDENKAQIIILIRDMNSAEELTKYYKEKNKGYLESISFVTIGSGRDVAKEYGVNSWPHAFVLDGNHKIRSQSKILSADKVRDVLRGI